MKRDLLSHQVENAALRKQMQRARSQLLNLMAKVKHGLTVREMRGNLRRIHEGLEVDQRGRNPKDYDD